MQSLYLKGFDSISSLIFRNQVTDDVLNEFAQECKNLQLIHIENCGGLSNIGIKEICNKCTNLLSLAIIHTYNKKITVRGVEEIAKCKKLESLTFVSLFDTKITDDAIKEIVRECTNLQKLNLSWSKITDEGLKEIGLNCKNLKSLNICSCYRITDEGLKEIGLNIPNLESLNINSCSKITDEGLKEIAKGCKKLEALDIGYCHEIKSSGLNEIAKMCKNLWSLDLSSMRNIDSVLNELDNEFLNLRSVTLTKCGYRTVNLRKLVKSAKNLEKLDLSKSYALEDVRDDLDKDWFKKVAKDFKNLKLLNLSWYKGWKLKEVDLLELGKECTKLKELDLSGCMEITKRG